MPTISLSQLRQSTSQAMNGGSYNYNGVPYVYDPAKKGFTIDPNYQAQQNTQNSVNTSMAEANAKTKLTNDQPVDPKDLLGYTDLTGKPLQPGPTVTHGYLTSGKVKYQAPKTEAQLLKEKNDQETVSTAQADIQNIIDDIKTASSKLNTYGSKTAPDLVAAGNAQDFNLLQHLKGYAAQKTGNRYAQQLTGVQGRVNQIVHDVAKVNRFNEHEISAFMHNVPSPYDTKEVANYKIGNLQKIIDTHFNALNQGNTQLPGTGATQSSKAPAGWTYLGTD